jgi:Plasmid stabilization system protein
VTRTVFLTDGAARDLDALYAGHYDRGGDTLADQFLDQIQVLLERLGEDAEQGKPLGDLQTFGLRDARQLRDPPWRIVYRIDETRVFVSLLAREDRSYQSLLQRRLLDA